MSEESLSPGAQLREAISSSAIQVPGRPNALAARMIEDAGFEALYLSGAAFSAGVMALPDVGLFTLTELVQQVNYFTARVAIPVIVDADTGFGEAVNVERTVARIGASRRCGDSTRRPGVAEAVRTPLGQDARRRGRDVRQVAGGGFRAGR